MNEKILHLFACWKDEFASSEKELTKLDSVGGDGDIGIVMMDGFAELYNYVNTLEENDIGKILYFAGKKLNNVASSSMGTLLSSGFINAGKKLKGKTDLEKEDLVILIEQIAEGIQNLGKANEGEKTILDAIFPAAREARANIDKPAHEMMNACVKACEKGVDNAANMVAKHGRLAFRQEESAGIVDPGTVVALHFVKAIQKSVNESEY